MSCIRTKILCGLLVTLCCIADRCRAQSSAVRLQKGQLLSFVTSITKPGKDRAREEYFQRLQPLATPHGFKLAGSLQIGATHPAEYQPSPPIMNIFSWPSSAAHERFTQDSRWPNLKAMRNSIWRELRIVNVPVPEQTTLKFRAGKLYRVVFVWLSTDHPNDLQQYREAMSGTARTLGARYLFETGGESYESLVDPRRPPDRMWIVEWPNRQAHQSYLASPAFQDNSPLFQTGVERFEVFETSFSFPRRR